MAGVQDGLRAINSHHRNMESQQIFFSTTGEAPFSKHNDLRLRNIFLLFSCIISDNLGSVPFIGSLSTIAVTGYPHGRTL